MNQVGCNLVQLPIFFNSAQFPEDSFVLLIMTIFSAFSLQSSDLWCPGSGRMWSIAHLVVLGSVSYTVKDASHKQHRHRTEVTMFPDDFSCHLSAVRISRMEQLPLWQPRS